MKYLKQLTIILSVCFAGEIVKFILPFPIPSSIYGMIIMFLLLASGILKPEKVEKVSDLLIEYMPVMFVPGAAAIINSWGLLKSMLPAAVCSIILITPFVMVVTGKVTQIIVEKGGKQQ